MAVPSSHTAGQGPGERIPPLGILQLKFHSHFADRRLSCAMQAMWVHKRVHEKEKYPRLDSTRSVRLVLMAATMVFPDRDALPVTPRTDSCSELLLHGTIRQKRALNMARPTMCLEKTPIQSDLPFPLHPSTFVH